MVIWVRIPYGISTVVVQWWPCSWLLGTKIYHTDYQHMAYHISYGCYASRLTIASEGVEIHRCKWREVICMGDVITILH